MLHASIEETPPQYVVTLEQWLVGGDHGANGLAGVLDSRILWRQELWT